MSDEIYEKFNNVVKNVSELHEYFDSKDLSAIEVIEASMNLLVQVMVYANISRHSFEKILSEMEGLFVSESAKAFIRQRTAEEEDCSSEEKD